MTILGRRTCGALLALMTVSCLPARTVSHNAVPADRAQLIGNLLGFQSRQDVRGLLGEGLAPWEVLEDSRHEPDFTKHVYLVHGFIHLGQRGDLLLEFFNDRLVQTRFYPEQFESYLERLHASGIPVAMGGTVTLSKHTRVTSGRDSRSAYVAWTDGRLQDEAAAWIVRHSQLDSIGVQDCCVRPNMAPQNDLCTVFGMGSLARQWRRTDRPSTGA